MSVNDAQPWTTAASRLAERLRNPRRTYMPDPPGLVVRPAALQPAKPVQPATPVEEAATSTGSMLLRPGGIEASLTATTVFAWLGSLVLFGGGVGMFLIGSLFSEALLNVGLQPASQHDPFTVVGGILLTESCSCCGTGCSTCLATPVAPLWLFIQRGSQRGGSFMDGLLSKVRQHDVDEDNAIPQTVLVGARAGQSF